MESKIDKYRYLKVYLWKYTDERLLTGTDL